MRPTACYSRGVIFSLVPRPRHRRPDSVAHDDLKISGTRDCRDLNGTSQLSAPSLPRWRNAVRQSANVDTHWGKGRFSPLCGSPDAIRVRLCAGGNERPNRLGRRHDRSADRLSSTCFWSSCRPHGHRLCRWCWSEMALVIIAHRA